MAFSDYSATPSDNTIIGENTFIGPNMARSNVRPALQQLAADGRLLSDTLFAATGAQGFPVFADQAAGEAGTTTGEFFAYPDGAGAIIYAERTADGSTVVAQSATGAQINGKVDKISLPANVKDYGAEGDGSTDDTDAIADAVATGRAVYFPEGTYITEGIVAAADGQQFFGDGPNLSVVTLKAGETGFTFSSNDKQVHIRDLKFFGGDDTGKTEAGDAEPTAAAADDRSGVEFDCDLETTFHNVVIHGFGNRGLAARSGSGGSRQGGVALSNVHVYNCWMGFEAGPNVAEYLRVTGSTFNGCNVGVRSSSGNQTFVGCIMSDNYKNFHLLGTGIGNNSHGSLIGCLLNHGTIWAIHAEDVTNGFSFIGCNMFYGSVELTNCAGVVIQGGIFDLDGFSVTGGGRNYVLDNYCDDGLDNLYNTASGGVITFHRNFRADGTYVLNNEMMKFGASAFTAGDQPVLHIGENGAMEGNGLRVLTNGGDGLIKFQAYSGSALVANPTLTILRTNGNLGFFGATPVARQALAAAASDAATTQTLANSLRTALINLGLGA